MYIYLAKAPYLNTECLDMYKIGISKDVLSRMKSLSNSGVSGHYQLLYKKEVHQASSLEASVFRTLYYYRYREDREFFVFHSPEFAIDAVASAVRFHQDGLPVDSMITMPDELLERLEDRWVDDEFLV